MPDSYAVTACAGERWIAIPLASVSRVERSVALETPAHEQGALLGWVNDGGKVVPVVSLHLCLGEPFDGLNSRQRLLICEEDDREVALLVDRVGDVTLLPQQDVLTGHSDWLPASGLCGALQKADGLILVYAVNTFLCGLNIKNPLAKEATDVG